MWEFIKQIIKDPFFGIVWALIGFVLGHWLAIGRDKRKEFNAAASIFRESFTEEIILLNKERGRRPGWGEGFYERRQTAYKIICDAIKKQTKAYIEFRHHVGRFNRSGFDSAWEQYAEPNKGKGETTPIIEYESLGEPKKEKEIRKTILHRINTLVKYATPK